MIHIIFGMAGCVIGVALIAFGAFLLYLAWEMADPPYSQREIDILKREAIQGQSESERALLWMRVSDAKNPDQGSWASNLAVWIIIIVGAIILASSILLIFWPR